MAHTYNKGQTIICRGSFKDGVTEEYVDPTTVTFRECDPSNNATDHVYGVDLNVVKDSTGHYHYNLTLDEAGTWYYRWDCAGTYAGAAEGMVVVCDPYYSGW